MLEVEVPDRDDPNKTVKVNRYVIDPKEKATGVVFGKFIPWTGPKGHGRLVELAEKQFGKGNYIIASPFRKGNNPKVDIFTDEQKAKIIETANPGVKFIRIQGVFPPKIFTTLIYDHDIKRPVLVVGPDRIEEFKKFFREYKSTNKGTEDPNDKELFGKGEYYYISGERDTSGTKVRDALLKGNKKEFMALTGYDQKMWDLMRSMLKTNGIIKENCMRFGQFYLTEGGNVVVKGTPADKIPVEKLSEEQFEQAKEEILALLRALDTNYNKATGRNLWKNLDSLIKSGKIFSGSTRLFFSKPYEEFIKYKKAVGDIDLQIPEEEIDSLNKFLDSNEGKQFGPFTFLGQGGRSPLQTNTIFQTKSFPGLFKSVQLDFEPTFWEKGSPTEFSTFGHYSSWEDIKSSIKGVFIKYLLRILVGMEKLGKIAVQTKTGKISTSDRFKEPVAEKGFSADKGVRTKFEPILDDKGQIKKTEDGTPIYRELATAESNYERNLDNIFSIVFKQAPTSEEKKNFHSFVGTLQMMKKYLTLEQIKSIFKRFKMLLWGRMAQEIEQGQFTDGINQNDFKTKMAAYNKILEVFPELKAEEERFDELIKNYYDELSQKKLKVKK